MSGRRPPRSTAAAVGCGVPSEIRMRNAFAPERAAVEWVISMSRASHLRVLRLILLCVLLPLGGSVGSQHVRARSKPAAELGPTAGPLPMSPPGGIASPTERDGND